MLYFIIYGFRKIEHSLFCHALKRDKTWIKLVNTWTMKYFHGKTFQDKKRRRKSGSTSSKKAGSKAANDSINQREKEMKTPNNKRK